MGLLDTKLLSRLEQLQLSTRRPLAGYLAGEHRSPRYGSSLNFSDYRAYHAGDDYRLIDYHMLARLDLLLIKLFEADDELNVTLMVDTSASMGSDGKMLHAKRVAAAIGFIALVRRDAVTVKTLQRHQIAARFTGRQSSLDMFNHIEKLAASGSTTMMSAVQRILSRVGPPGLTILISDLLTPEWDRSISQLPSRGGDFVVVHVLSRSEIKPEIHGDFEIVDRETKEKVPVSLSSETLQEYRSHALAWLDEVSSRCRYLGAAYTQTFSDDDIEKVLLSNWREQTVIR